MKTERIVLRRANNILDVFHGEEGFHVQQWTRFLIVRGYLKYLKGAQLAAHDLLAVKKMIGV